MVNHESKEATWSNQQTKARPGSNRTPTTSSMNLPEASGPSAKGGFSATTRLDASTEIIKILDKIEGKLAAFPPR